MIDAPDTPLVSALRPSPNVEPRRGDVAPDLLLLHYTGMASCARAIDWLTTPGTALELWAWRKVKAQRGGKALIWQPRVQILTSNDFKPQPQQEVTQ